MNNEKMQGNWNVIKGKLKKEFSKLTDDYPLYGEGKADELIGKIQKRT